MNESLSVEVQADAFTVTAGASKSCVIRVGETCHRACLDDPSVRDDQGTHRSSPLRTRYRLLGSGS